MTNDHPIVVPDRHEPNQRRDLNLEDAAAAYVKVLRDAAPGHGTNREASVDKTNALLAHHTGRLPDNLGQLGFLYRRALQFRLMPTSLDP